MQESNITLEEFKAQIKKCQKKRKSNINNSYGSYDYYRYYRENRRNKNEPYVNMHIYLKVIRNINNRLRDLFSDGKIDIIFPVKMGRLELIKVPIRKRIVDGKLITNTYVDWNKTLELWYEDEEAMNNKMLVRNNPKYKFIIKYDRVKAEYINKFYMEFKPNRELKNKLKKNIRDGKIDAYLAN